MTARQGFTLAELMVVILVIALVVAIVLPFFQRVYAVQRQVACQNNLHKLGQAYYTRLTSGNIRGLVSASVPVHTWPGSLGPSVGGDKDVFICPEDEAVDYSYSGARQLLREIYIEVFNSDAHLGDYNNHLWDVPLDEEYASEWVWRLSEEQFQDFLSTPGHGQNYNYSGFQAGANPNVYWFVFEDQGWHGGGDKDYYDVMLKIEASDTEIRITPQPGSAGYSFTLAMGKGDKKEILIKDVERFNSTYVLKGSFGTASYGMNSMAASIPRAKSKLLILDYEKIIARGSDYDDRDAWFEDPEVFPVKTVRGRPLPEFFRHFDKANVLLGDGTVHPLSFEEINIDDGRARQKYWNPLDGPTQR